MCSLRIETLSGDDDFKPCIIDGRAILSSRIFLIRHAKHGVLSACLNRGVYHCDCLLMMFIFKLCFMISRWGIMIVRFVPTLCEEVGVIYDCFLMIMKFLSVMCWSLAMVVLNFG